MARQAPLLGSLLALLYLLVDLFSDVLLGVPFSEVELEHGISDSLRVSAAFSGTAFWKGA